MTQGDVLFTVASWEPRFWLGFEKVNMTRKFSYVFMYYYAEYATLSEGNRKQVRGYCHESRIELIEQKLAFFEPTGSWRTLYVSISKAHLSKRSIVVDITTMPRETIWIMFDLLDDSTNDIRWIYHQPRGYNSEWLSRDPDLPRLVPKMGGVSELGRPTRLFVLSGFDTDRTKQLINFFEPELILLGVQSGPQFDNLSQNAERHRREFGRDPIVSLFEVDAYAVDQGLAVIASKVQEHVDAANLIMASLGPKPSAVALYHIHKRNPGTSLAYAPSKEFNPEYSYGLGNCISGKL